MNQTYVIAEAGVNHNGSVETACQLVDVAAKAGADAIKFQTFDAKALVTRSAGKATYQKKTTDQSESQLEMLQKLQLKKSDYARILKRCQEQGIEFLSTPFDLGSLDFLIKELGISRIKVPSGEITNGPFLCEVARRNLPIILSTGMSYIGEVEQALASFAFGYLNKDLTPNEGLIYDAYRSPEGRQKLLENVTLLHCTTEYPAPMDQVNLRAMQGLHETFHLNYGYSDHTQGINLAVAATALGASVIEKHFTLDRKLPGPDHKASLEPEELTLMVEGIREVSVALGERHKYPSAAEARNRTIARKSIVARTNIAKGEAFSPENLDIKRPGSGLSPFNYWELLGTKAQRSFEKDDLISL